MYAYLIRRMLWMIPTFLGILVINFGVLRLQGPSLSRAMTKSASGEAGEVDAKNAAASIESYLVKFRTTGLDLPALINTRGFLTKADAVAWLRATARGPGIDEATRNKREKDLWVAGRFLVEPLSQVIADDGLADLHGPASLAFTLCAFYPLSRDELERVPLEEQRARQVRNQDLKALRIEHRNDAGSGFTTTDPRAAEKRKALAAFMERNVEAYPRGGSGRWRALLWETGFTDFVGKLFTGRLYSTDRQEYVFSLIADRWQVSFGLQLAAIIIAWGIAVPLGIRSARMANTFEDRAVTQTLFVVWSLPSFVVGALLLHYFCLDEPGKPAWFPNRGLISPDHLWFSTPRLVLDVLWHAFLPLVVLCYASFTELSRYMRANILEQLSADYVRTARAKGVSEDQILGGHVVRNSLITMITLGAGLLAALFGGSVIVEFVFSIPGLGTLLLEAARAQDAPLVMGSTVVSVTLLLLGILIADILYAVADPRIRSRYA